VSAYELLVVDDEREPLENILTLLFPLIQNVAEEAFPLACTYPIQPGTETHHAMASRMVKMYLSVWESSILVSLPQYFSQANMQRSIDLLLRVLGYPLPKGLDTNSQPQDFRIISLKKNALRIAAK